jgi:DNA primase
MSNRYSKEKLRMLRNHVPISRLIADFLRIPCKVSDGYFRFLCPLCSEFQTATNPKTNLARCFRCQKNFNPIDIVMAVKACNFREAVELIDGLQNCS